MNQYLASRLRLREPRNLAALISLYESNYFRLMRLAPELDELRGTVVSRVAGALDLYLTVLDRSKFTTTIALTYRFADDDDVAFEPNTRIRVYHDAMVVEVLSQHRRRRRTDAPNGAGRPRAELDRRWEMNRFLQKWLGFCQRQGHIFLRCTVRGADGAGVTCGSPPPMRRV